eukprot:753414-Hanusia_phi.AAC.11
MTRTVSETVAASLAYRSDSDSDSIEPGRLVAGNFGTRNVPGRIGLPGRPAPRRSPGAVTLRHMIEQASCKLARSAAVGTPLH